MPEEKGSKTQQAIRFRAHQRIEEVADEISRFSYSVIAGTLTRFISDNITDRKEYEALINQMEKTEKEMQNG